MTNRVLVVAAALLLTCLGRGAAAADLPEHSERPSLNAQKALTVLGYLGVNNHDTKNFVERMDSHVDGNYFNLAQDHVPGGALTLHYQFQAEQSALPTIGRRRSIELKYAPDDMPLPVAITVRPGCALAGLHFHFN